MSRALTIVVGVIALAVVVAFANRCLEAFSAESLGNAMAEEFSGEVAVGLREETLVVRFREAPPGGIEAARARIAELVAEHYEGYAADLDVAVCGGPNDDETGRTWCAKLAEE
jgi:hypothetical protein